jgi:hypothetical protein
MVKDTTIKLSREFKDSLTENMRKGETYEDYIKKFVVGKKHER